MKPTSEQTKKAILGAGESVNPDEVGTLPLSYSGTFESVNETNFRANKKAIFGAGQSVNPDVVGTLPLSYSGTI